MTSEYDETINYKHSLCLLTNLDYLKENQILCDVTLIVDKTIKFPCHRCILAACSDYFRSMFTNGMREATQHDIELKGISAKGLHKAIQVIYTSTTTLDDEFDIFELIAAATHLQIPSVIKFCEINFLKRINTTNFIEYIEMAKLYELNNVLKQIDSYLVKNLSKIAQDNCLKLIEYDQFLKYLQSDQLNIREIDLFKLVWKWINDNQLIDSNGNSNDYSKIRDMMKLIRFALISPLDLVNKVQNVPYMLNDHVCRQFILDALNYHVIPHTQPIQTYLNTNLRSYKSVILCIGGREINPNPGLHDSCHLNIISKSQSIKKHYLTNLPSVLSHMQCVVLANFLYVIGGCTTQCAHGESAVNTVHRYDPRFGVWIQLTSMIERRAYFYACKLNSKIYSIGGKNRDGPISSVECYDPSDNTWKLIHSLPAPYHAHAGVVSDNRIYISGGYSLGTFTPDLQVYLPESNTWEDLSQMHTPRGWHCMCEFNNNLYVFGGCCLNISNQQAQAVLQVEYYSILNDQWTIVSPLLNLHKEASFFTSENFIYIIGGFNVQAKCGQKLVSRYDFKKDLWENVSHLAIAQTGCSYVTIDLPIYTYNQVFNEELNLTSNEYDYCTYEASSAAASSSHF